MMRLTFLFLILLFIQEVFSQEIEFMEIPPPEQPKKHISTISTDCFDPQPEFPGGRREVIRYLSENIVYPQIAIDSKLSGKIIVIVTIDSDGKVTDVKIGRGMPDCLECEEEVIRVICSMPDWIPTKQQGKTRRSYVTIPVTFVAE